MIIKITISSTKAPPFSQMRGELHLDPGPEVCRAITHGPEIFGIPFEFLSIPASVSGMEHSTNPSWILIPWRLGSYVGMWIVPACCRDHIDCPIGRICPGRDLSKEALLYTAACLLAVFKIEPVKDQNGEDIPLELKTGIIL
jgi:hypothetical protein